MSILQQAAIRYRNSLVLPNGTASTQINPALIVSFMRNIETLGYELSPAAISAALHIENEKTFKTWAVDVIEELTALKGAGYTYEPMYPNFPQQVRETPEVELWVNAITHYFGDLLGVRILPAYKKDARFPLYENTNLIRLEWDADLSAETLLTNMLEVKLSYSEKDVEILNGLVDLVSLSKVERVLPESIPNKENLAWLAKAVRENPDTTKAVFARTETATDLLRIAAVYSDRHPSLGESGKFGRISRVERKLFIRSLERMGNLTEDFKRNREQWKRLAERLHPNEYISAVSYLGQSFEAIRSSKNLPAWGTAVEKAFEQNNLISVVSLLSERPGIFARRLNQLVSNASTDESEYIVKEFANIAEKISSPVLWQVISFFRTKWEFPNRKVNTIFPKGTSSNAFVLDVKEPVHRDEIVYLNIIDIAQNALQAQYSQREAFGKVYFDTDSFGPTIPFGLRNYSAASKVLGRGSRMAFNVDKTLRMFVYWKDQNGSRVDLDLAAVALDENFNRVDEITYYNLRSFGGVHSGDITSAPNGASEFIDIPVKDFLKKVKARYVAMTVLSFTGQKFNELDVAFAGFMEREDSESGEIYEPKTVQNSFTINTAGRNVVPMVFDMVLGEVIWLDLPLQGRSGFVNNVATNHRSISAAITGLVEKSFVTVKEVIRLNLKARNAVLVDSAEEADTVITVKDGVMSIGFDEIISKWL